MSVDYIVIGAGSAGCAVAARLCEDPSNNVALIDAGGRDWSPSIHIPAGIVLGRNNYDWAYQGEPDNSRGGIQEIWSAGNAFGGSSTINGMMYVRGNPADFDAWAHAGCTGWDYQNVLPYFRRMECWEDGDSDFRGGEGPIHIVRDPVGHPLTHSFVQAAQSAGFSFNNDYNGETQEGVAIVQANQKRGLRHTAARAYLGWWRRPKNLRLIQRAEITKINFVGHKATSVSYVKNGQQKSLTCHREIVLSAGALISPKLLMLSGIGPAKHLGEHDVDVLINRPGVGRNFQEHPVTALSWQVNVPTLNTEKVLSLNSIKHAVNYLIHQRGPLAACVGAAQIIHKSDAKIQLPNLQLIFLPLGYDLVEVKNTVELRLHELPHVTVAIAALHPDNRGSISLRSKDPHAPPRIHFELLGSEKAKQTLIDGCRIARRIVSHQPLQQFVVQESFPGVDLATDNDQGWQEYISEATYRGDHPCGSCKMGDISDPMAVVDPQLKVIGVDGLRVADASIMPRAISGNTNAAVMMIGERAADFILA